MQKTSRLPVVHLRIGVLYVGAIVAAVETAILGIATYANELAFPVSDSTFWITLTGLALASVIGAQAYVTLAGTRAERKQRLADKIQHYHELLKEHAYQEWVKTSPTRLDALSPSEVGKDRSLENLYLAGPAFESLTVNDPDHNYYRDALSHLFAYPVVQTDPASISPLLGDGLKTSFQSVGDLVEGISRYSKDHNARVLDFSNWEAQSLKSMTKECSLKHDYNGRHSTPNITLSPESMSLANLMKHLDGQSREDPRKLVAIAVGESGEWVLRSTKANTPQSSKEDFDVASSSSLEKLKQLKKLITAFSRERARRLQPLAESTAVFEQACGLTRQNLQIIINAVDRGTFGGKCRTEERLATA